ncbi:MAG: hypothetical protein KC766_30450, partial [Myxococcales bacterium]|nr:hypothetical protein [Myxococcales bacterium]
TGGSAGAMTGGSAGTTTAGGSAGMNAGGTGGSATGGTGGSSGTLEGLLMSEYVEGSMANKAIELFNGTGRTLDLSACELVFYFASSTNQAQVPLTGPSGGFEPNHTWVICDDGGSESLLNACDQKSDVQFFFNGDDAIELVCGGVVVDSFGKVGEDPGDGWGDPNGTTYTRDHTLRRKCSVTHGDTNSGDDFIPSVEWDGFGLNQLDGLRSHCGHSTPTSAGQ